MYFRRIEYMESLLRRNIQFICILFLSQQNSIHAYKSSVIVCDNSKVHVSNLDWKFIDKHKLCLFSTSPYWSCVNLCKKLILIIKNKVKIREREGVNINHRTFKQIVNEITRKEFSECIKRNVTKTLNLIKMNYLFILNLISILKLFTQWLILTCFLIY